MPLRQPWRRVTMTFAAAVGALAGVSLGVAGAATTVDTAGASSKAVPVTLGIVYDGTGLYAASDQGEAVALEAWAKWVNTHGGIGGRKVALVAKNDASDATTAVSDMNAVISSGAAAVVPASSTAGALKKEVDAAHIAAIGGIEDQLEWGTTLNYFAAGTTPENYASAITQLGLPADKKMGIFYAAGSATASASLPLYKAAFEQAGGTTVGQWSVSSTAVTFTSQCLAAKQAGAQEVLFNLGAATVLRIVPACAAQGYKPQYVAPDQVVTLTALKVPSMSGTLIAYSNAPYYASPSLIPGLKTYDAAMNKYEKRWLSSPNSGESNILGWVSGTLFADAVTAARVPLDKPVTRQDVFEGLYRLKGDTLKGLSGPLTFTKNGQYQQTCFFAGKISKGKFLATEAKPKCPPQLTLPS